MLLEYPRQYVRRRTESTEVLDASHVRVAVEQHIQIPETQQDWLAWRGATEAPDLSQGPRSAAERELPVIVSLGMHDKTRLPDLQITADDGRHITLLTRRNRAEILWTLLADKYMDHLEEELISEIARLAISVFELSRESSLIAIDRIVCCLNVDFNRASYDWKTWVEFASTFDQAVGIGEPIPPDVTAEKALVGSLLAHANVSHLLVEVDAIPGHSIVLRLQYTDHWDAVSDRWSALRRVAMDSGVDVDSVGKVYTKSRLLTTFESWEKPGADAFRWLLSATARRLSKASLFLCLTPVTYARFHPDADHAQLYYYLPDVPTGTYVVRAFWNSLEDSLAAKEATRINANPEALDLPKALIAEREAFWESLFEAHVETHQGMRSAVGLNSWFKTTKDNLMAVNVGVDRFGFTNTLATSVAALIMVCYVRFAVDPNMPPSALSGGKNDLSAYGSIVVSVVGGLKAVATQQSGSFKAKIARGPRYIVRAYSAVLLFLGVSLAVPEEPSIRFGLAGAALSLSVPVTAYLVVLRYHRLETRQECSSDEDQPGLSWSQRLWLEGQDIQTARLTVAWRSAVLTTMLISLFVVTLILVHYNHDVALVRGFRGWMKAFTSWL